MIFEREIYPLEKYFTETDKIYAHISENKNPETLKEHLNLVIKYAEKIYKDKNLENVFQNFKNIFLKDIPELKEIWEEMILNVFYMHDIGKTNRNFQLNKMKNSYFKKNIYVQSSKHSNLSGVIYLNYFFEKIFDLCINGKIKEENTTILLYFLILNTYIILRHHSETESFTENFYENFLNGEYEILFEDIKNYCPNILYELKKEYEIDKILERDDFKIGSSSWEKIFIKNEWDIINVYIYVKFIYALLVSADFYATHEYTSGNPVETFNLLTNIDEYINFFHNTEVYKGIKKHKQTGTFFDKSNINYYRSEMFLEAEKNLKKDIDKNIFFLEAPTGSGKTIISVNLALTLLKENKKLNKIFYIFPFNTLVEQTYNSLTEIFHKDNIAVINSITPIKKEEIDDEDGSRQIDYEKSLLNRQFIHFPVILTTHVHLFNNLFGTDRESSFSLPHLANSVIIIDEIQSYRNKIWKEIIIFLQKYAEVLNIKIIIMSATLPNLSVLLEERINIPNLIQERDKYFKNPIFKERVHLNFEFLEKEYEREELLNLLENRIIEEYKNKDKKIVIEFIKKQSAIDFYNALAGKYSELDNDIFLITGDDNKLERKRIIDETKNSSRKGIILIATQVIEAGVDIDMDIGFKNISILDAEEQFLGRINRSCKKIGCTVYFFELDKGSGIYKHDERTPANLTLENENMRGVLKSKDFEKFYNIVLQELEKETKKYKEDSIDVFRERKLGYLNFKEVFERMKLINDNMRTKMLFLSRDIQTGREKISGNEIWQEFKNIFLDKDMGYAERQIKLSEIMEKVDLFSYNIPDILLKNISINDKIGENIIFIENGEEYFTNGKFDRNKLKISSEYEFIS